MSTRTSGPTPPTPRPAPADADLFGPDPSGPDPSDVDPSGTELARGRQPGLDAGAPEAAAARAATTTSAATEGGRRPLRAWQTAALDLYDDDPGRRDFLVTATPGAGKTTFALALAARLLERRVVDRVVVVCPTDHLRTQWADAADRAGVVLDPSLPNSVGPVPAGAQGYVTTYAQVAGKPALHAARSTARRTLVVLDEVHHAGDGLSWGDACAEAFDGARRRLCLTGTPFRTRPGERIPFVHYEDVGGGELRSRADYTYGYREALADAVVRPVVFAAYTGTSRWRNSAGEVVAASLSEPGTRSVEAAAWKTALDPRGGWVPHVLAAMDDRITHLRENGVPDAGGLVLASDQDAARAYAGVVERVTGEKPVLILSDDPRASRKIEDFGAGTQRIAVCVRMVSEGVDVPRAACLAWMTSYRTPLFFAQAVGRVVRARGPRESATVFLPAVRPLLALAAELEQEREHVIPAPAQAADDELDLLPPPEREAGDAVGEHESLEADAQFAHVLHGGRAVMGGQEGTGGPVAPEDEDFLGIPGLLTAEQTASLLASRDEETRRRIAAGRAGAADGGETVTEPSPEPEEDVAAWRSTAGLRREVNTLVGRVAARSGVPHAVVHRRLRQEVPGPASATASPELLGRRRDHLLASL